MNKKLDFLDLIVEKKILTREEVTELSQKYWNEYYTILVYLIDSKTAPKKKLGRLWGDSLGVAYIELKKAQFQKETVNKLPEEFARKHEIIPVYELNNVITVATSDPNNEILHNKIEQMTKCHVSLVFSFPEEINDAIDQHYSNEDSFKNLTKELSVSKTRVDIDKLPSVISDKTKKQLVNNSKIIEKQVEDGKTPDIEICNDIRDTIIDEVQQKLDLNIMQCINQLRIVDEYTYSHSINVAMLSAAFAKVLGYSTTAIKELTFGALLHDIGNMRIPKNILYKSGQMSNEEIALIKKHPYLGYQILQKMDVSEKIMDIAYSHHERMDGNGYPRSLTKESLSPYTQIVSIINIYDTLVSDKPNKGKISHHEALNLMFIESSNAFNFDLLHKFVNLIYKQNVSALKKEAFSYILYGEQKV